MRRYARTGGGFEDVAAYSRAVRVGGRIVTSATAALGDDGTALHPGDAYAQSQAAIATALAAVAELGGSAADVTRSRVYLTAGADWKAAIRAHQEAFVGINPANTTVYVHALLPAEALVEIELEAEVESDRLGTPNTEADHV